MWKQLLTGVTALIFFLTTLAGRGADAQPDRSQLSAAIDALSQTVASGATDHTDSVLKKIGYGPQFTSQIADWDNLSAYRKIETMALAAQRAPGGSAEQALALMSQAMARQWPAHLDEIAIQKLPDVGAQPVRFASLKGPSPRALAAHLDEAVYALASYVDEGTMSVSMLLRQAGVSEPRIMNLVRTHATARDVLTAAVAMQGGLPRQHAFMHELLNKAEPFYPTIASDPDVARFREAHPRPEHPAVIVPPPDLTPPSGAPPPPRQPPSGGTDGASTEDVGPRGGPGAPTRSLGEEIPPPHDPEPGPRTGGSRGGGGGGGGRGPRFKPSGGGGGAGEVHPSQPIPRPSGIKPNPGAIWGNVRCHVE